MPVAPPIACSPREHRTFQQLPQSHHRAAQNDLLSDAAHELRSPLASIKGYGELLANGALTNFDLQRIGERIRTQADRLAATVEDILELAAIQAHRGANFRHRMISIESLLAETLDALGLDRSDRIEIDLPEHDLPRIYADRARLSRALLNILDNAIKYSPDDLPTILRVRPREKLSTTRWRAISIHVIDRGMGINASETHRVFERFYRARNAMSTPGSGLGLSITEQIVQLHGGTVRLRSRLHKGTVVAVTLPLANQPPHSSPLHVKPNSRRRI